MVTAMEATALVALFPILMKSIEATEEATKAPTNKETLPVLVIMPELEEALVSAMPKVSLASMEDQDSVSDSVPATAQDMAVMATALLMFTVDMVASDMVATEAMVAMAVAAFVI